MGAVISTLVGLAGEYTAIPFGIIIATASLLAIIAYLVLVKKPKTATSSKLQNT